MLRRRITLLALCALLLTFTAGCGATSAATPAAGTSAPTASPATLPDYTTITVAEVTMQFEVPADWARLGDENVWTPKDGGNLQLGFNWMPLEPPMIPEAVMLPNHAVSVSAEPVTLAWGAGQRITVEVYAPAAQNAPEPAPVIAVETHTLFQMQLGDTKYGLDFYASAPTAEALAALEPLFNHILLSATPATAAP